MSTKKISPNPELSYLVVAGHRRRGRTFPVAVPRLSVEPTRPRVVRLLPVDVAHPAQRLPGQLPVAGQLVLGHGPLVAVQGPGHVARAEQRAAAVSNLG